MIQCKCCVHKLNIIFQGTQNSLHPQYANDFSCHLWFYHYILHFTELFILIVMVLYKKLKLSGIMEGLQKADEL